MTIHMQAAEQLVTENDEFIARALEHASIPTLMMSMIHMSGDFSLLDGAIRPRKPDNIFEFTGNIGEEDAASIRRQALEIIKAYRDRGCSLPPPPASEQIRAMMNFVLDQPMPEEYVPMMLEEMALDNIDARAFRWTKPPSSEEKDAFPVVIIGAGMSGLVAAIRLEEAGLPYIILEKNATVGGTWYENSYPGCRVDVSNHFYSYSFEPNHDWSEYFSQRDEIYAYLERCADKYGIRSNIRFGQEVTRAVYSEEDKIWRLDVRTDEGDVSLDARIIICAVGQLNRPKMPDIKGLESFAGHAFHSAEWEHEHDLEGKRIAVIGTGASAFQFVPEIAKLAGKLEIFQRSAPWMVHNPVYHSVVSEEKKWLLKHLPYYARWYRFMIFYLTSDFRLPYLFVDPEWPHPERSVNALNDESRRLYTQSIERQVGDDPELLAKVLPKYPPNLKRILQDDGSWISALKRPNVELITDAIASVVPEGVLDENGILHEADILIYGTGFQTEKFLMPMEIIGKGKHDLREDWGITGRAYLGITVPNHPNFFMLYGPSTNLAHGGSIIFHSECQVRYIMNSIRFMIENGYREMDCKEAVHDAFSRKLEERLARMVWSHTGSSNWYKNSEGKVVSVSPWRLVDYWRWTSEEKRDADYMLAR